jgi:bifunctional non-homologous end joining protein LigD
MKIARSKITRRICAGKNPWMGENGWLLIKHKDEFASLKDISKKDKSALSGKTIAIMEKTSEKVWKAGREQKLAAPKKEAKKKLNEAVDQGQAEQVISVAIKRPGFIEKCTQI